MSYSRWGRSAIEAMAVGAAVILSTDEKLGPMVTTGNFELLRQLNFGATPLVEPVTVSGAVEKLRGYESADADAVANRVRDTCELGPSVDQIIAVYEQAIAEAALQPPPSQLACERAVSAYLEQTAICHKPLALEAARIAALERKIAARGEPVTRGWKQRLLGNAAVQWMFGRSIRFVVRLIRN